MRALTQALALAIEFALLWAFGRAGFTLAGGGATGWAVATAAVAGLVVLWGLFAAPKSTRRLAGPALLAFKTGLFLAGTAALAYSGATGASAIFALVAVLYLLLALRLGIL